MRITLELASLCAIRQYLPFTKLCPLAPANDECFWDWQDREEHVRAGIRAEDTYVIDDGPSDDTGDIARALGAAVLRNQKKPISSSVIVLGSQQLDLCAMLPDRVVEITSEILPSELPAPPED